MENDMDDDDYMELGGLIGEYGITNVFSAALAHQEQYFEERLADLLKAASNALADLEGIMPEFEPSGDREHPAWQTITDLRNAIEMAKAGFE
jgi:hypothetical protein